MAQRAFRPRNWDFSVNGKRPDDRVCGICGKPHREPGRWNKAIVALLGLAAMLAALVAMVGRARGAEPAHLDDLRRFHEIGGIAASEWNVSSCDFHFHSSLSRSHRFIASVYLPFARQASQTNVSRRILPHADDFEWLNQHRVPLILRADNLAQAFPDDPMYRLPILAESISGSALVWRLSKEGRYSDERLADVFGTPKHWTAEGQRLAASVYGMDLFHRAKQASFVVVSENNEGFFGSWRDATTRVKLPSGKYERRWKATDDIAANVSLRLARRVVELGTTSNPDRFAGEYNARRSDLYRSYFDALRSKWLGWNLYSTAYSVDIDPESDTAPEARHYDGFGPSLYLRAHERYDLTGREYLSAIERTIPAWRTARQENPREFREMYVSAEASAGNQAGQAATAGLERGTTELIDPDRFQGFVEWAAWSSHEPGVPLLIRHWFPASSEPVDLFFDQERREKYPGAAGFRQSDYIAAVAAVPDRIMGNPTIRDYWLRGQTLPQSYPAGPVTCWHVVTEHPDLSAWLVFAWSPCRMPQFVRVELPGGLTTGFELARPSGYWELVMDSVSTKEIQ